MSLGSTLRTAREAHGITTSELAARTHMLVQIVEGLENEDFRRIPAPIYGRGFIKLYCEAVGLDPKPLQAEFMDLFNRPKNTSEKIDMPRPARQDTKPLSPPPPVETPQSASEAPPQPMPADIAYPASEEAPQPVSEAVMMDIDPSLRQPAAVASREPQPVNDLGDLFAAASRQETRHPTAQTPPPQPPPKRTYEDLFEHAYAAGNKEPKPSAAEKFRNTMSNVSSGVFANVQKLPRNTGRIVMVAICGILLLAFLWWGISALYKATSHTQVDTATEIQDPPKKDKVSPAEDAPASQRRQPEATKAKSGQAAKPASASSVVSVKPEDLKSSGIEVPALYID